MNEDRIISTIKDFLSDEFETDLHEVSPTASLKDTLDLDSLDFVDLVVLIEKNFGFKMAGEEFTGILTFQDLYNYVGKRLQEAAGTH
jgi:acyl carrier protein